MKKVKKNIIDNINLELENYKPNNFPETFDLVIYYYFLAIYYKKTDPSGFPLVSATIPSTPFPITVASNE